MTRGKRGGLQLSCSQECSTFSVLNFIFLKSFAFVESESLAFSSVAFCVVAELRVEH